VKNITLLQMLGMILLILMLEDLAQQELFLIINTSTFLAAEIVFWQLKTLLFVCKKLKSIAMRRTYGKLFL